MTKQDLFCENEELITECLALCEERMQGILTEEAEVETPRVTLSYGAELAAFGLLLTDTLRKSLSGELKRQDEENLRKRNEALYADILPDVYETSFANPAFSCKMLGKARGRVAAAVYSELRAQIPYAYAGLTKPVCYALELFLEIYGLLENEADANALKRALFYYVHDYTGEFVFNRMSEQFSESFPYYKSILTDDSLGNRKKLYLLGEYISENERAMSDFLESLPEEKIDSMAATFTDGYLRGFRVMMVSLEGKSIADLRGTVGMERLHKKVMENLAEHGITVLVYPPVRTIFGRSYGRMNGTGSQPANPQYDYDHRNDYQLVLNKKLLENRLAKTEEAYRFYADSCRAYAGPLVQESFGEPGFLPVNKPEVITADERMQKLLTEQRTRLGMIRETHLPGDAYSFSIIAYPIPAIGPKFADIFRETVKLNTLDNDTYIRIQQKLCDALNEGKYVHVKGMGDNKTDLTVALYDRTDPAAQTIFENCTADVNIPVGEVFTSPKLNGTNGVLHVTSVYLDGKRFRNLTITFENGMIKDYSCENFPTKEENEAYIRENILFSHETLPMGEFAIGTNTEAYRMGRVFDCQAELPILIAEKTGPHFAVGDTCYSHAEDHAVYNPDGKEIIARDNELVRNRDKEPEKAYFNCHTDITIPYDELGHLIVIGEDGRKTEILREGRFVLPGTEELNAPLCDINTPAGRK